MKSGKIYKITNNVNSHLYIGQTRKTIARRLQEHKQYARRGGQNALSYAIRKYGEDKFIVALIENCEYENLNKREIFWISELNTAFGPGYNMTSGGSMGYVLTEEAKNKATRSKKGKDNPFFGKRHTDETKLAISKAKLGQKHSRATCQKIKSWQQKNGNSFKGKKHSEESRKKMSLAQQGKKHDAEQIGRQRSSIMKTIKKKHGYDFIHQYSRSGEFVAQFDDAYDASISVLGHRKGAYSIKRCCNKVRKSAYGSIWRYA